MARTKKKKKPRNALLDYLVYLAFRLVQAVMQAFPLDTNLRACRTLGALIYRFDRKHRLRAHGHIRQSLGPEVSEERIAHLARGSFESLVVLICEIIFTPRLVTPQTWQRYIKICDLGEPIRLLLDNKSGVILLSGHHGNWELMGYTLAALGFENFSVARLIDNPFTNAYVLGVRERTGQHILNKRGALGQVDDLLREKKIVCFIADQDAGPRGVFVDFFGRPASTYRSIALVAIWHKVPIIVGYTQRQGKRFFHEWHVQDVIYPKDWQDRDDQVHYITQRYTKAIEDFVRKAPEQYLWSHRRWKTQPEDEEENREKRRASTNRSRSTNV